VTQFIVALEFAAVGAHAWGRGYSPGGSPVPGPATPLAALPVLLRPLPRAAYGAASRMRASEQLSGTNPRAPAT
jgi:hypothetical protein